MQNLQLPDSEDLISYRDKLENLNMQLSWVGQGMPEPYLIHLAQTQLKYPDMTRTLRLFKSQTQLLVPPSALSRISSWDLNVLIASRAYLWWCCNYISSSETLQITLIFCGWWLLSRRVQII